MKIIEDPIFQQLIKDRGLKTATIKSYQYALSKYCKLVGHTPTSLIEEAEDEEDRNLRLRRRKITQYFHDFQNYLEGNDHSYESIDKQISIIRTFYYHYDIKLPKKPKLVNETQSELKIPSTSEIKFALKNSNPCFEAIIVLMSSSAMGRSEIINLTIQDLVDSVSKYQQITLKDLQSIGEIRKELVANVEGPLTWKVRRVKTDFRYVTFSTNESLEYILLYLESKKPVESVDDQLFMNKWGNPLTFKTFSQYFRDLNIRCGFGIQGRSIYFRSHNLRKWFANQLENTSLGYMNTRRLMGHQVYDQTSRRYFKSNEDVLYDLYFENMAAVSIFSNVKVFNHTDDNIKQILEDNQRMEEDIMVLKRLVGMRKRKENEV